MCFKVKEQSNQEKAMEILRLAGIEIEELSEESKIEEAEIMVDHTYYFECSACGFYETFRAFDFEKLYDEETRQVTCCDCEKVFKANFREGYAVKE